MIELQVFDIQKMQVFPHKFKENEVNLRVLNEHSATYISTQMIKISELQKEEKGQFSNEVVQSIFKHYCEQFQTDVIYLPQYIKPIVNNKQGLSFTHLAISDKLLKAICCTIPFIPNIYELEFNKNHIADMLSTLVLFASFTNPNIKSLKFT